MESRSHYWEDVAVGAVIGTGFTYVFTRPMVRKQKISASPVIGNGVYGAVAQIQY